MSTAQLQGPVSRGDSHVAVAMGLNGKRLFVQSINFTSSSSWTVLNTQTIDGRNIPAGALWLFQPDGDCQIELGAASRALTNKNSGWIPASCFDEQFAELADVGLNLKGRSGSGSVQVFVLV